MLIGNVTVNTARFLFETCYITRQINGHSPTKLGLLQSMILSENDNIFVCWYQILPQSHMRSEEHTSELQSHVRISYAVFCLKKKKNKNKKKR